MFFIDIHPNVPKVNAVANPARVASPILLPPCSSLNIPSYTTANFPIASLVLK
jgi:hypothetical protein